MDINQPSIDIKNKKLEKENKRTALFEMLRSTNPFSRIEAIKKLGQMKIGIDEIAASLVDKDGRVRIAAAEALGTLNSEDITTEHKNYLLAAIEDPNDKVCSATIISIGKLGIEEARERLIPLLDDKNAYIVTSTITTLARLGPKELGKLILPFLERKNFHIQFTTVKALGILNYEEASSILFEKLQNLLNPELNVRAELIGKYVETLGIFKYLPAIPLLTDIAQKNVGVRSRAINALIEMNAEEAVPILIPMLADPGLKIRDSLIRLMVKTNFSATNILLRPLLYDRNTDIKALAITVLANNKDPRSLKTIRQIIKNDGSSRIRSIALNALGESLGMDAIGDLIEFAKDPNTDVRKAVVNNLGKFKNLSSEAIETLNILANDQVEEIQIMAKEILLSHNETPTKQVLEKQNTKNQILPDEILEKREELIHHLNKWQDGLSILLNTNNIEEITEIDKAITLLITYLDEQNIL